MKSTWILAIVGFVILDKCMGEKLIIDTDGGADDAFAIFSLLKNEENQVPNTTRHEIVAITCVHGNFKENEVEKNILQILTVANRTDIPVYSGAKKPLIGHFESDNFYGEGSFVNLAAGRSYEVRKTINSSKKAANVLVDLAEKYAGNISIVAIGPLTNIALAMSLDENFVRKIYKIYAMGGSVRGIGNLRPNVEFNFAGDPEGAFITLNSSLPGQIFLLPWETVIETNIPRVWRWQVFGNLRSNIAHYLNGIEMYSLMKKKSWVSSDLILAGYVIRPDIAIESFEANIDVVLDGKARGSLLIDYQNSDEDEMNVDVINKIDVAKFKRLLLNLFR